MCPIELRGSLKENKAHTTNPKLHGKAAGLFGRDAARLDIAWIFSVLCRFLWGSPVFILVGFLIFIIV